MHGGELLFALGVVLLGFALAWGLLRNRSRNRENDKITEEAAHELYTDPLSYDRKREDLKKQVRRS